MSEKKKDMSDLFTEITGETSVTESQDEASMGTRLRDDKSDGRSTATTICPKCGHDKAYYEMKQIRSADESETRFFECVDFDILPALKREDSHGTVPLDWDIVVYDVTCS